MRECDYLIIGAGIGGASAGYRLAENASVIVVEREERPGYHTTGRSVAVYTEAYGPHVIRALAIAGGEFFTAPPKGFTDKPLCHPHGLMFVARADQRAILEAALAGFAHEGVNVGCDRLKPDLDGLGPCGGKRAHGKHEKFQQLACQSDLPVGGVLVAAPGRRRNGC